MNRKRYIYRDAGTGQLVTREYAEANPNTTVREPFQRPNQEPERLMDEPTPEPKDDGFDPQ